MFGNVPSPRLWRWACGLILNGHCKKIKELEPNRKTKPDPPTWKETAHTQTRRIEAPHPAKTQRSPAAPRRRRTPVRFTFCVGAGKILEMSMDPQEALRMDTWRGKSRPTVCASMWMREVLHKQAQCRFNFPSGSFVTQRCQCYVLKSNVLQ